MRRPNFCTMRSGTPIDRGVVLVAATGNDNTDQPGYPAAYPEVFGVSATDRGRKAANIRTTAITSTRRLPA